MGGAVGPRTGSASKSLPQKKGPSPGGGRGRGLGAPEPLAQRRELGRNDEHVLLLDELAAGVGRPGAAGPRLVAHGKAIGGVLVGPDMDPLVEPAELGMAAEGERRIFQPPLDPFGPAL